MSKMTIDQIKEGYTALDREKKDWVRWLVAFGVLLIVCALLIWATAGSGGRVYPVYINEILASNSRYPNPEGRCCDFIELYNSADHAVDLTGFQLGDVAGSTRYAFPKGTVIGANDYLVVYCDKDTEDPTYAPFGLSRSGGEAIYLIASNNAIADKVVTVAADLDETMMLTEEGEWVVSAAVTPGRANSTDPEQGLGIYNPGLSPVRITEFSAVKSGYCAAIGQVCDWIELYNTGDEDADISGFTLSDNVGNNKYRFPAGTVIPAGTYRIVYCAEGQESPEIAPFGLSEKGGETVVLKNSHGLIVEIVETLPMEIGCSMAVNADHTWEVTREISLGYENTPAGNAAFMESIGARKGTIVISELMAATQYVMPDVSGAFPDWVELYNAGDTAVNLEGWFLSDNASDPQKWSFPDFPMEPGQRAIVFLSGRDRAEEEVHAGFSLSSAGEELLLTSYLGVTIDAVSFGASETNCSFVFDPDTHEPALTNIPTPGYSNDAQGYHAFADGSAPFGALAIWEVMVDNDKYLAQARGVCYDWVELRNVSDKTIRLSDYTLSDDVDVPGMYVLPDKELAPGEMIAIILSGSTSKSNKDYDHANFALNAAEDQIFVYHKDGKLSDFAYLRDIPPQKSYGRSAETGGFFYMSPTPLKENKAGNRQISAEPTSTLSAGVYIGEEGYLVPLTAEGTIYYTTDGSDPTKKSKEYTEPIQINKSTVLRAVAIEDGKMISDVYTATFLVEKPHSIPVISLVTDPDNLWGSNGIYKSGDIKIKEEIRPVNFSYSGEDGSFSIDCEMKLHGATTVKAFSKKSFGLHFRDSYDGPLDYDIFGDGEVTSFSSLIVRAAHESSFSTHMHDIVMHDIASQVSDTMLCQKYKYAALYLNGEYWGLYAIRELLSAEHYASYMNVPADTVTKVRFAIDKQNNLKKFYDFLEKGDLKSKKNYEYAKSVLDLESYADWIIFQAYVSNPDINGNMRFFYSSQDKIWRAALVDVDLGMMDTGGFKKIATSFHHGRIVNALLQNEEFQDLIAKRLAELLAGPMSDKNMIATVDRIAASIEDEIPREAERWGYKTVNWEHFVKDMRKYCKGRAKYLIDNLSATVGFSKKEKEAYFGELLR